MKSIINQYKKELLQVARYSVETVTNYISCIYEYIDYAKEQLNINPLKAKANHIWLWMATLKQKGISPSRLIHHRSALKGLFELLIKMDKIDQNPVDATSILISRSPQRLPINCCAPLIKVAGWVNVTS